MWTNSGASRTLDASQHSFAAVIGIHEKQLSDADVNLIQSVQDWKRRQMLKNQTCSGVLSYSPFTFTARTAQPAALAFTVPSFNVLMNGDVVSITGFQSDDQTKNVVTVPAPTFWSTGSAASPASLYVAYIEFWYQRVDPATGTGYYVDSSNVRYFYLNGCMNPSPDSTQLVADDAIDPFEGIKTTERVQLQWAIRVAAIDPAYDFTKYNFGLDPGATTTQTVFSQAGQASGQTAAPYQFTNMAAANGDAGLWRAGDGVPTNNLSTVDGYSYAMPLAIIFQRNNGIYDLSQNPLGSASAGTTGSGLLASNQTARFDGKYSDVVFPEDVVDTRSLVSLSGWDSDQLMREGFVDVISGTTQLALARGDSPGNLPIAAGSQLDYMITMAPNSIANTNTIGSFDGFRNGFSSADQTFYLTQRVSVNQKSVGIVGTRWQKGDSITITLPGTTPATIEYIQAQGLVNNVLGGTSIPVLYLTGQIQVTGLGTKAVTITLISDLTGTSYDPGINPLYITLGIEYPAASGIDLVHIPNTVYGGKLTDAVTGQSLPVFAVSDYAVTAVPAAIPGAVGQAYNPSYSDTILGTRVQLTLPASEGEAMVDSNGNTTTSFTITLTDLPGNLTGLYAVSAFDQVTKASYQIASRSVSGTTGTVAIQGAIPSTSTLVFNFLVLNTVQLSYNPPIKAVTMIQETVLAGTVTDGDYPVDPRITVVSVSNYGSSYNLVVLATTSGTLSGIAGDDVNKLIWVKNTLGNYIAVQISSAVFANGFVTLTVPGTVNLEVQRFFVVAGLVPALGANSSLALAMNYIPYQGEGRTGVDYEIVHTEDTALVTTNGTGVAPIPGLKDVYPYNRSLPITTVLPSQAAWSEASLLNQPVASVCDSNFVAKSFLNVEHTMEVPSHTNDFIEPIRDDKRKSFQLLIASGSRGFSKAQPHLGFAIAPVNPKTTLATDVTSTSSALTLYINNVTGNDNNDGMSVLSPFLTVGAMLNALPSTLRHPCSLQFIPTGTAYSLASLKSSLQVAALGDGVIRSAKYYALGVVQFTIQESGRLVFTAQAGTLGNIVIDATGFTGFGDGPTSAFFIDNTRVLFNQITFQGFSDPAVKGLDSDVEFVNCAFNNNLTAGSFEQASTVIVEGGTITLGSSGTGFILSQSELDASSVTLSVTTGATPGAFYVAERGSSLSLGNHSAAQEINVAANTLIAEAELNSSIVADSTFTSQGCAAISQNSVLSRPVNSTPFSGGITQDASSNVTTSL